MARLTFQYSKVGEWLDTVGDDITNYAYCMALAVGLARFSPYALALRRGRRGASASSHRVGHDVSPYDPMGHGRLARDPQSGWWHRVREPARAVFLHHRQARFFCPGHRADQRGPASPALAFFIFAVGTVPVLITVVVNDRAISHLVPPARNA